MKAERIVKTSIVFPYNPGSLQTCGSSLGYSMTTIFFFLPKGRQFSDTNCKSSIMCQLCHYILSLEQRHHQSQLKGLPRQVDNVQDVTPHRPWRVWTEQKEQPLNSGVHQHSERTNPKLSKPLKLLPVCSCSFALLMIKQLQAPSCGD